MSSQQNDFDSFYLDKLGARRQLYASEAIWGRLNEPTVVISALILLVSVLYNIFGSPILFDEISNFLTSVVWDTLVFVTPLPLLDRLDAWQNPQLSPRPMLAAQLDTHASKSEKMRRVLGIDRSGGMMASVFQARRRAFSMTGSALGLKLDTQRPPGLGNRDNSCFQNSILQGLAALRPLPSYLSACLRIAEAEGVGNNDSTAVTQILRSLVSDLNDPMNNGRTLWTPNKLKFMSTWTQQDAQEYFSKILDDIDKGASQALKLSRKETGFEAEGSGKDDAAASQHSADSGYQSLSSSSKASDAISFRNPLEGLLAQRVSCVQCGHSDGLSMIPFNCLTLSLGLEKGQHDLYERLDAYSSVESIEGVECPKCTLLKAQRLLTTLVGRMRTEGVSDEQLAEPLRRLEAVETALEEDMFDDKTLRETCKISSQAKVTTTKTKQIVIARPPQSLAIHMNRSVFDPMTFNMIKNSAPVHFPRTLDLGPWCLGSADASSLCAGQEKTASEGDVEEEWLTDPKSSMVAGDLRPSRLTGPIYELRAAVTHAGRHENGHYICYRKFPRFDVPYADSPASKTDSVLDSDDIGENETGADPVPEPNADSRTGDENDMVWWRLSDHNVSQVDEQAISNLAPGVFMLFYDCIDPAMVLQQETEKHQEAAESPEPASANMEEQDMEGPADGSPGSGTAQTEPEVPVSLASGLGTVDRKPSCEAEKEPVLENEDAEATHGKTLEASR